MGQNGERMKIEKENGREFVRLEHPDKKVHWANRDVLIETWIIDEFLKYLEVRKEVKE